MRINRLCNEMHQWRRERDVKNIISCETTILDYPVHMLEKSVRKPLPTCDGPEKACFVTWLQKYRDVRVCNYLIPLFDCHRSGYTPAYVSFVMRVDEQRICHSILANSANQIPVCFYWLNGGRRDGFLPTLFKPCQPTALLVLNRLQLVHPGVVSCTSSSLLTLSLSLFASLIWHSSRDIVRWQEMSPGKTSSVPQATTRRDLNWKPSSPKGMLHTWVNCLPAYPKHIVIVVHRSSFFETVWLVEIYSEEDNCKHGFSTSEFFSNFHLSRSVCIPQMSW